MRGRSLRVRADTKDVLCHYLLKEGKDKLLTETVEVELYDAQAAKERRCHCHSAGFEE